MVEVNRVLLTFLPGTQEEDAFAYLDDVRLAIRDIRLGGIRSIKQAPVAEADEIDVTGWDSAIKTYSMPLEASSVSILKSIASAWLLGKEGRSLSIKVGDVLTVNATPSEVNVLLDTTLARATRNA